MTTKADRELAALRAKVRATTTREHPAVASAKRAIRRNLAHLSQKDVFELAARADIFRYGDDRGQWLLSAAHATGRPDQPWQCDEPSVTKRGAR